jgi:hypothetical protein
MSMATKQALYALALLIAALTPGAASAAQGSTPAVPEPPCAACISVVVSSGRASVLPAALNGVGVLLEADPAEPGLPALLDGIAARGGRPGLLVTRLPVDASLPSFRHAETVLIDARGVALAPDALTFELRTALTALRAHGPAKLGVDPPPALADSLARDTAGYADFLVRPAGAAPFSGAWKRGGTLASAPAAIALTRTSLAVRWLFDLPEDDDVARDALAAIASAARVFTPGLLPAASDAVIACDGREAEVFRDPASLALGALLTGCGAAAHVTTQPPRLLERVQIDADTALVRLPETTDDRFSTGVEVAARRRLTVEEIVARHQAAAARQAAAIRTLVSEGTLTVSFQAPGFPAPLTVSSQTVIYDGEGRTDIEQRELRVNGIAFAGGRVPRLPIVEPERVAAPPLAITLGDMYRYRLSGEDTIGGRPAYVVAFDPLSTSAPLFKGRAWIDADDFGLMRTEAAQTGLRGPVVSSEQTDEFSRTPEGWWLLARSDIRQLYEGAAYRTPIHRVLALGTHAVNASDFDARRRAAYASSHVILRDTPAGYRYLDDDGRRAAIEGKASDTNAAATAQHVRRATSVRTLVFGVIVDPNITRPLPFAGVNYLDFDLFGRGVQLDLFFGGTYGQLAFSVPSIRGSRWQLAGRAFGIASSYNDRAFVGGRERYDENVRQRPASASVSLLRPLTPRLTIRAGYELDYTHFDESGATAPDFRIPASQVAHALRLALEGQLRGWEGSIWWRPARRAGWRAWGRGDGGDYDPAAATFQRYGATVARSFLISPRLVSRASAEAVSGRDLDRFSQYSFGTFDNRLRGYPAALIRYDRGAAVRTATAFSAGRLIRIDGFADVAVVRDTGFARGPSRFVGFGAAFEAPAPFGTLVAAEWGYGIQGVNADGRRGTHVVRITGYKLF